MYAGTYQLNPVEQEELSQIAEYAVKAHRDTNHKYGTPPLPYEYHLLEVFRMAQKFKAYVHPSEQKDVFAACWCHDLIEDARQSYNDVKHHTNEVVADLVYALTDVRGKNRKERHGGDYYPILLATPNAVFVKICDRLANIKHSAAEGGRMLGMYQKEYSEFRQTLDPNNTYEELWEYMETFFTT